MTLYSQSIHYYRTNTFGESTFSRPIESFLQLGVSTNMTVLFMYEAITIPVLDSTLGIQDQKVFVTH